MDLNYHQPYLGAIQGVGHAGDVLGEVLTDLARQRYQQQYQAAHLGLQREQMQATSAYHNQMLRQQEKHYADQAAVQAAQALLDTQKQKDLVRQGELGRDLETSFSQYGDPLLEDVQEDVLRNITSSAAGLASYHPENIAKQTSQMLEFGNPRSRLLMATGAHPQQSIPSGGTSLNPLTGQPDYVSPQKLNPEQMMVDEFGNPIAMGVSSPQRALADARAAEVKLKTDAANRQVELGNRLATALTPVVTTNNVPMKRQYWNPLELPGQAPTVTSTNLPSTPLAPIIAELIASHPQTLAKQFAELQAMDNEGIRNYIATGTHLPSTNRPPVIRSQGPGQQLVDETGKVISPQLPMPHTLRSQSPGQQIVDEAGRVISPQLPVTSRDMTDVNLQRRLGTLQALLGRVLGNPPIVPGTNDDLFPVYQQGTNELFQTMQEIAARRQGTNAPARAPAAGAKATPKQKADLANQLSQANPSWSRQQILDEVKRQLGD